MASLGFVCCLLTIAAAAEPPVRSDQPYAISFPQQETRFVRFVIHGSSSGEPCVDELEVYGPGGKQNLALAKGGAKATASSCLPGHAIHQIGHLNDGRYGNQYSWIAAGTGPEWAQVELPKVTAVSKLVFSRDRKRQYADRVPIRFEVQLSTDGQQWKTVRKVATKAAAVTVRHRSGHGFALALPAPPPPPKVPRAGDVKPAQSKTGVQELLRYAILGEEHAWLKTYGRADLAQRLLNTPYRKKRYPPHIGDDRLPLPPLGEVPTIDGRLDDACWDEASRGVVRVADPYAFDQGPLVKYAVTAGRHGNGLLLAIRTNRLLSSHVAVVSTGDGQGGGVVACTRDGLVFNTYEASGKLKASQPLEGAFDASLSAFELRLPLAWFPDCRHRGIRVGLGMGGRHTVAEGRAVNFVFSPLSIAEITPCISGTFKVRLSAGAATQAVTVRGDTTGLSDGVTLGAGQSKTITIPVPPGSIGPEFELAVDDDLGQSYTLHLFRYDPIERTLDLLEEMVARFAAKGRDVGRPRARAAELRRRQAALLAMETPDLPTERRTLLQARWAKRELLLGEPALRPIERILFVKRQAFRPSHNYSVLLDSAWRPGGAVCLLEIPHRDGRYVPGEARVTTLFDAGSGIARNPTADFDISRIYFAYRPSKDEFFHLMAMNPDGSDLEQLTFGPFHDYWPCPLPDGGLAFITTRCRARFICWRPQAAVLFRMDADGQNIRPLSFANLTEWGPSVTSDGRIIWQRSEYIDKGADYGHTLWAIRPDGSKPELIFGNTILLPQGYANGREVPGTHEICCTLISHFGDLNGPIALLDIDRGRFNPSAITSITPEVPWPGYWPMSECFRDPVPLSADYFLVSHAPRDRFALYVIDRFGNREILHLDPAICSMCPTPLRAVQTPPVLHGNDLALEPANEHKAATAGRAHAQDWGQFVIADVYRGIEHAVPRGTVKYIRVCQEVRADLLQMPDGTYQADHTPFMHWYATPVDKIRGPYGWPSYVAKGTWGLVPVEEDGSANFYAPAGKVLYFQVLDEDFNELQRMRSVVQLQPGETRSCVGCHEDRRHAPVVRHGTALKRAARKPQPPPWGPGPFSYEEVVQPVLDHQCARCHDANDQQKIDLTGTLDNDRIPASYKTLVLQGWVHHLDLGYQSGENLKVEPLTFGTVKSKLWDVLDAGHYDVELSEAEMRAIKCWTDLNCPLWPDYIFRDDRPKTR